MTFNRLIASGARTLAAWAIAGALAMACTVAVAQPAGLSPEAAAAFNRWMQASCVGEEAIKLADELRRYGAPMAAAFRKAIQTGPPAGEVRAARAAAEARFALREKFPMQDFAIEGVSEKDLAAFSRVSRQAYVDDQVRRFTTGYRANAVAGLGIVGGPGARETLMRLQKNKRDPLSVAASEALRTSKQ